jgi:integrase
MPEKVIKFENENMKIYEAIQKYFKELNRNNRDYEQEFENKNTQKTYETEIRSYFRIMRGKEEGSELEYLTMADLQITLDDIEEYKEILLDMKKEDGTYMYVNKTVNKKIAAMKSFIRYMAKKKFIEDASYLNLIKAEKERHVHYGSLSVEEVLQMAELAKQEKRKGMIKYYLILFALDTCIRQNALLNLKWSNFIEQDDNKIIVEGVDKGNKEFRKEISPEFYKELLTIKTDDNDIVFNITKRELFDMMQRLKTKMNIPESRRIVFHSIRRTGANFYFRIAGNDITQAQKALGHSNISTTGIYMNPLDLGAAGAVSSAGLDLDNELYKKVDLEVLQQAISECPKDLRFILNLKIHELKTKNN